jgi:ribosomal-protein-alanine N-acetyltransferase
MLLNLSRCDVRSWEPGDLRSLVHHGNNRRIWENLRDRFPSPYTIRDGAAFLKHARNAAPETSFAIAVGGAAVGAIGVALQHDVERVSAELGYWIGEEYWGRGIVSEAVPPMTRYAIERYGLTRVFALPFAHNTASCRVLEKSGYVLEARLHRSAIKDGRIVDQCQYAFMAPEPGARG